MTSSRYIVQRFAQAFGYQRKNQRLSDAASEMHLLREAEAYLGASIWKKIEPIEELSSEYWTIRKLARKQSELSTQLKVCEQRLEEAHGERADIIELHSVEDDPELIETRKNLFANLEQMTMKRDRVIEEGRQVRRLYNGIKTKLEVLATEEGHSSEDILEAEEQLEVTKERFNALKRKRDEIADEIARGDEKLDALNETIKQRNEVAELAASKAFITINQVNKEVWELRAESGLIETRLHQLHMEIGRYVSRNTSQDQGCAAAAKEHQGLIDVMRALRRSIALNHKLAGTI